MTLPTISVLVPTYGRTRVLGECIQSFMQQTYQGRMEMIVLNDHPAQTLEMDPATYRPGRPVVLINAERRFPDCGTKRNALVGMAAGDYVCFWDDDDLYMPDALDRLVRLWSTRHQSFRCVRDSHCWQLQATGRFVGTGQAVPAGAGLELIVRDAGPLWSMLMEKAAIEEVGGYAAMDRRQDGDLCRRLTRRGWVAGQSNTSGIPACIRRIDGVPYVHAIDFVGWAGPQDNQASSDFHAAASSQQIVDGSEPAGVVCINPQWSQDYAAMVRQAWTAHVPERTVPRVGEPASAI